MEDKPYTKILENLRNNGVQEIDHLIGLGEQESFYIDFKEVATKLSDNKLNDSDRKNYAKAISGFANTSGGLLVWGVKDNGSGNFSKREIENPEKFVSLLNNEVSLLTLPPQKEVNSFAIKDSNNKGFVITEIPKYYFSPVQVITGIKDIQYRYYIRSGSSFAPANHDLLTGLYNRQRSSKTIFCWNTDKNSYHEDENEIKCRIGFTIQNKGLGVLRNVWINFSAGNINLELEKTQQISVFEGWNMWGLGLNLVTNDAYKFAPQHFLNPFIIVFKIDKNNLPENGFIYISFGSDQSAPVELEIKFDKKKFEKFMKIGKRDADSFISNFGFNNKDALRNI